MGSGSEGKCMPNGRDVGSVAGGLGGRAGGGGEGRGRSSSLVRHGGGRFS